MLIPTDKSVRVRSPIVVPYPASRLRIATPQSRKHVWTPKSSDNRRATSDLRSKSPGMPCNTRRPHHTNERRAVHEFAVPRQDPSPSPGYASVAPRKRRPSFQERRPAPPSIATGGGRTRCNGPTIDLAGPTTGFPLAAASPVERANATVRRVGSTKGIREELVKGREAGRLTGRSRISLRASGEAPASSPGRR